MADIFEDDGTLACLHIPADRVNKRFQCPEEQQTNLVNKTFWVVDYFPVFDRDPEGNLSRLRDALLSGTYKTSRYTFFQVRDPKERTIARLPYYPDRIVHHAIISILEPIFTRLYTADTYACIKGRGGHLARHRIIQAMRKDPEETRYCLKLDIRKYYPSVNQLYWLAEIY